MTTRPILLDNDLDLEYDRNGFVVIPGLARSEVPIMRKIYRRLVGKTPPGFHSTPYERDRAAKQTINSELSRTLSRVADELLGDYRILLSSFVTKSRGEDSVMPPHQDWTFVNEPEYGSMNMWIPLVDVDSRNGAMSVLPRGHLIPRTIRGSETLNAFAEIEESVSEKMVQIPMSAGDVLIHDHQLLHSSPANSKRRPRIVAGAALVHRDSQAIHYRRVGPGQMERFDLEDRFFTDFTYGDVEMPASAVYKGLVEFENPTFRLSDIDESTRRGEA